MGVKEMCYYFDNSATTFPKPECVYYAMDSFYRNYGGSSGRGQYSLSAIADKIVSETREKIKCLLDCENKDLIFTPSATIALNMIIQGKISELNSTGKIPNVYITPFEHNSVTRVLYHFEKDKRITVEQLSISENFIYDIEKIENQFEKQKPDLVIVSHVSNVIGLVAPVLEIFSIAKKYECTTVLDMAQSAGLVPLDLKTELVDFAVFAGHKTLYGPFGIAGFVKTPSCSLEPVLFGGTGTESANQSMPETIPQKYEFGSQNSLAIAGLNASVKWFMENQTEIRKKEKGNHKRILDLLRKYSFIHIKGPENRENCIGVVSCTFDDYSADNIGNVLDEFGVAVRTGLQCAPLSHKLLKTFPSGTVRFSPGYFTDDKDFKRLEEALEYISENR